MRTSFRDLAGSPLTRFRRALAAHNGPAAYAAATELSEVELADALALTVLLAQDRELFERACVRWVGRFSTEVRGVRLAQAHLVLASLGSLATRSAAGAHALAELFDELARPELAAVLEGWLERRAS